MASRSKRHRADPFEVLGLGRGASADDVRQARNRLAKEHHPDVGGDAEYMQELNAATDAALLLIAGGSATPSATTQPTTQRSSRPSGRSPTGRPAAGRARREHPSFTIEALPAEAFEALLIVANVLGQVADDDPPYRLEAVLDEVDAWYRLEVVPDGGGSTVSLTVAAPASVTEVRDQLVAELNALDWTADGPRRRLPW